jgi:hypothetical protein
VRIVLERWSNDAEQNKVAAAFASDATPQELAKQFGEMEAIGSFRTISGQANPIRYAREYTDDAGTRHLVLLSDQQVAFWKGASAAGSLDGAYTLIEVRFGGDVEGEGKFTHEAGAADAAGGRIRIEDYDDKVLGLIGVQKVSEDFSMDIS